MLRLLTLRAPTRNFFHQIARDNSVQQKILKNCTKQGNILISSCPHNDTNKNFAITSNLETFFCQNCNKIGQFPQNFEQNENSCNGHSLVDIVDSTRPTHVRHIPPNDMSARSLLKKIPQKVLDYFDISTSPDEILNLPHFGINLQNHHNATQEQLIGGLFGFKNLISFPALPRVFITRDELHALVLHQHTGDVCLSLQGDFSKLDDKLLLILGFVENVVLCGRNFGAVALQLGEERSSYARDAEWVVGGGIIKQFKFLKNYYRGEPTDKFSRQNSNNETNRSSDFDLNIGEPTDKFSRQNSNNETNRFSDFDLNSGEPTNNSSPQDSLKDLNPVPLIRSFSSLKSSILTNLTTNVSGLKWLRFPRLTRLLKGHRPGELTIITGLTGSGKTTFTSEYSLDLLIQGVPTLWGNFEMEDSILLQKMMTQFSYSVSPDDLLERFEEISSDFSRLPLYLMDKKTIGKFSFLFEAMSKSIDKFGVKHVVIDNLQFIAGTSSDNLDRFYSQEVLFHKLRVFCSEKNVHVTIIIHPRKSNETEPLNLCSVGGTATCTQEADNVLIVQCVRRGEGVKRYLEVVKNRFDGECGVVDYFFNRGTQCFEDGGVPMEDDILL